MDWVDWNLAQPPIAAMRPNEEHHGGAPSVNELLHSFENNIDETENE